MDPNSLENNPVTENETADEIKELQEVSDDFEVVVSEDEPQEPTDEETDDDDADDEEYDDDADEDDSEGEDDYSEDEEDDEDDAEEDEEEDLKKYSKNVQKRIRREVRLRKQAEDSIRQAVTQRNQVLQASQQFVQENETLQEKYDKLEDQYAELLGNNIAGSIETKQNQMVKARDEGDAAAEIKLQSELDDLRMHKRQLEEFKDGLTTTREERASKRKEQLNQQSQGEQNLVPKAVEWVQRNKSWLQKAENAPMIAYMKAVDSQLTAEGYDPQTDEYYKEVDRRLDSAFPKLRRKKKPAKKKRAVSKKAKAAPVGASGSKPRVSKNKVVLTKADLANMRNFGLDPEKQSDLKAYAQQKMQ